MNEEGGDIPGLDGGDDFTGRASGQPASRRQGDLRDQDHVGAMLHVFLTPPIGFALGLGREFGFGPLLGELVLGGFGFSLGGVGAALGFGELGLMRLFHLLLGFSGPAFGFLARLDLGLAGGLGDPFSLGLACGLFGGGFRLGVPLGSCSRFCFSRMRR